MGETPAAARVPAGVDEVLRLTTVLAGRVLATLQAGEPVPEDQCRALSAAVTLLRERDTTLPPDLEGSVAEIARRAADAIGVAPRPVSQTVSWTFARTRGAQPMTLSAPKPSAEA